jgi:malate dehydrogenase (oxaloacetate-decarboxylating)(NADP+)
MATQRDLSLAYSPGVAVPVLAIAEDPDRAYDYTVKGNLVAVISNGTAILGLGNLGALASKPVMEGKAVLFKRFADIDSIDLEVDTEDPDEFINCVRYLGQTFGGINLEDIKAPECFIIEQRLRELMDIPVFHDDQHGTAIIAAAGLINALALTGRDIARREARGQRRGRRRHRLRRTAQGDGRAADNVILCDTKGVVYKGRTEGMNQWKSAHAVETKARTLADAMKGADVCFGLSVKGAYHAGDDRVDGAAADHLRHGQSRSGDHAGGGGGDPRRRHHGDGRSDYPNQINNVLGFPYIFRGALDVRATTINDGDEDRRRQALAALAREDVPDEVAAAYGARPKYGRDYIIPVPFDPRLIYAVPPAVAKAAMDTGVARKPIVDMDAYKAQLSARRDPIASSLQRIFERCASPSAWSSPRARRSATASAWSTRTATSSPPAWSPAATPTPWSPA